jgi:hypothetical protein
VLKLPAIAVSLVLGIGFGYATLGVLSIIGSANLGFRLWWLEWLVGGAAGVGTYLIFSRLETRQTSQPRDDRGERAILRLAYRKGTELSLEEITRETLLDEGAALNALRELEGKGQAVALPGNRWRLGAS